jgi:hypothetical protein
MDHHDDRQAHLERLIARLADLVGPARALLSTMRLQTGAGAAELDQLLKMAGSISEQLHAIREEARRLRESCHRSAVVHEYFAEALARSLGLQQPVSHRSSGTMRAHALQRAADAHAKYGGSSFARLIHYSSKYLTRVHNADQFDDFGRKPNGLWVSVEGEHDWLSWCGGKIVYPAEALSRPTQIVLRPDAQVLHIKGPEALEAFDREFGGRSSWADQCSDPSLFEGHAVQWGKVAALYDGIVIAPYLPSIALDGTVRWYYGWDCAAGCIWNSAAIAELRPLKSPALSAPARQPELGTGRAPNRLPGLP